MDKEKNMSPADVDTQFIDCCPVPEGEVSGEAHYEANLDAARVRKLAMGEDLN